MIYNHIYTNNYHHIYMNHLDIQHHSHILHLIGNTTIINTWNNIREEKVKIDSLVHWHDFGILVIDENKNTQINIWAKNGMREVVSVIGVFICMWVVYPRLNFWGSSLCYWTAPLPTIYLILIWSLIQHPFFCSVCVHFGCFISHQIFNDTWTNNKLLRWSELFQGK